MYDSVRHYVYPDTDIFLLSFSVVSPSSLTNLASRWVPEVRRYRPDTPFMLVGMKRDLRETTDSSDTTQQFVDVAAAHKLAKEIGIFKSLNKN